MKILIVDIETSPHISCHFGRWGENIQPEKTLEESRVICWAAKWAGERKTMFMSEWGHGADEMIEGIYDLFDEADVVVGFNSKRFDVKRINSEFIRRGWTPPSPYEQVDLLLQVRKNFAFSSNRLKHLLKELDLTPKLEDNADMQLWIDVCVYNKAPARKRMEAYNKQDVKSTEELYDFMLGWITPHPNWGVYVDDVSDPDNPVCPNCGGRHMRKHKIRRTKVRKYRQWHCQDCGKYSRGRKHLERGEETEGRLV